MTWLLSSCTGMGLLERAHSYKDKVANKIKPSVGLFTYPILMASDILIYDAEIVPVGKDQVQHVEMTQDMAGHFNAKYKGEFLKYPKWRLSQTPKVPGVDGRKMSKSYDNTLWIFEEGKKLKKACGKIVTDSKLPAEPKNPDDINAYLLLELFLTEDEKTTWRENIKQGGDSAPGYGDMKKTLATKMDERFGDSRARYQHYLENTSEIEDRFSDGANRARAIAKDVLGRCRQAAGLGASPP